MNKCGRCMHYERCGHDYGECEIHPLWSYVSCLSSCEDFVKKNLNKGKDKPKR